MGYCLRDSVSLGMCLLGIKVFKGRHPKVREDMLGLGTARTYLSPRLEAYHLFEAQVVKKKRA